MDCFLLLFLGSGLTKGIQHEGARRKTCVLIFSSSLADTFPESTSTSLLRRGLFLRGQIV
jgi:hypothetical protein